MSALLRELIEKRKNDVINYEEYLRQIVELARKVHKPESGTEYPPEIRESAAKRAFYDHLNGDTVVANQIYNAVMSSKQDNFRGSKIKERKIWRAIRAVVKDDQEADHQVVTFYAVVGQAEKGQDKDNANHKFHKKIPPSHGSRLQRCVSAM